MKRLIFLFVFVFVAIISMIAQITDSTAAVVYTTGDTFLGFLQKNMWTLIFIAYAFISEWLGQTGKVKEGSIIAWVLNLIGKIVRKQGEVVKTKKAKFMNAPKILMFAVILSGIGLVSSAQSSFGNLFKPISDVLTFQTVDGQKSILGSTWIPRLTVGVSITQNTYNKKTSTTLESGEVLTTDAYIETKFAQFIGFGVGYQHYVAQADGTPFNNYGANLLLLTPIEDGGGLGIGLFGNFSVLQLGVDYNFTLKKVSLDTGIVFKF